MYPSEATITSLRWRKDLKKAAYGSEQRVYMLAASRGKVGILRKSLGVQRSVLGL